ncbi:MAG: hypothetical protein KDC98_10590 [Planctomycetes bacterium]|nr:hypothetical protein [Planctomycetota bacterium]
MRLMAPPTLVGLDRVDATHWQGMLSGGGEIVEFDLWRADERDPEGRPFVLLVPILAGGRVLMEIVAEDMFDRGFDVAFCKRAGSAMREGQRGPELQQLFARTVLHQRLFLAWLRDATAFEPQPQFVLGISLGGMIATAVAALERELTGVAICLSGADLQSLVPASAEARVQRWVEWRKDADGVGIDHLRWELHEYLTSDPLLLASAIATDKVFMVSARFDEVVPGKNQDLLWEALGRPARMTVPLGHYTAALAIGPILGAATDHFRELLPHVPAALPAAASPR